MARNRRHTTSVFTYTDYRKFLKDAYQQANKGLRHLTYRTIAEKAGFKSQGFFTQILQGKTNISPHTAAGLARAFSLTRRETLFFSLLVQYNQTTTHRDKKRLFERLLTFKEARFGLVQPEQYELFDKWYYTAILAALSYVAFTGDYESLGKTIVPSLNPEHTREAIAHLERLGLVAHDTEGRWSLTDKHLSTGPFTDSLIVNNFVINTLDIARDAFYRFPKDQRSFSAVTLSVSEDGYMKIKAASDEFRRTVVDIVKKDSNMDRVYQMNMQLFPLTILKPSSDQETR